MMAHPHEVQWPTKSTSTTSRETDHRHELYHGTADLLGPGSFGPGCPRRVRSGCGVSSAWPTRLVLEALLWLVGRYSEQGVLLHVCSKAFQRRPFRMTSSEVGARRARRAVGGAWRDSATMCYSGPGAGRSGGVLPGPVALRALEVASYRRSRRQGSGSTTHL